MKKVLGMKAAAVAAAVAAVVKSVVKAVGKAVVREVKARKLHRRRVIKKSHREIEIVSNPRFVYLAAANISIGKNKQTSKLKTILNLFSSFHLL